MADSRIALDNGSVLALTDERMIGIVSEIGRGQKLQGECWSDGYCQNNRV